MLNVLFRAFVPAVLLGEAEPKANEQSAKPAENLAVISQACNFVSKLQFFLNCFIIISLLFFLRKKKKKNSFLTRARRL